MSCARDKCAEPARIICGKCKQTKYCSDACQALHWTQSHKQVCHLIGANNDTVRLHESARVATIPDAIITRVVAVPWSTSIVWAVHQQGRVTEHDLLQPKVPGHVVFDISDEISQVLVQRPAPAEMRFADERGLLGVAFDPAFDDNRRVYFVYSTMRDLEPQSKADHMTRLSSWRVNDAGFVATGSMRDLFSIEQPELNHNGGALVFLPHPERTLLLGLGDGGGQRDRHGPELGHNIATTGIPMGNGQNRNTLLGGIAAFHIEPSGTAIRLVSGLSLGPSGMWAKGLRNPWTMTYDHETNRLIVFDVGQSKHELAFVVAEGDNARWPLYQGKTEEMIPSLVVEEANPNSRLPWARGRKIKPILEYDHVEGHMAAIIGGAVVRHGHHVTIVFGDYHTGLRAIDGSGDVINLGMLVNPDVPGEPLDVHHIMANPLNPYEVLAAGRNNFHMHGSDPKSYLLAIDLTPLWRSGKLPEEQLARHVSVPVLTTKDILKVFERAKQKAAITTSTLRPNHLVQMHLALWMRATQKWFRITNSPLAWDGSINIAASKARTATLFSSDENALSTRDLFALDQPGKDLQYIHTTGGDGAMAMTVFPGGVPLYLGGHLVGGFGVSGDSVDNDEVVAIHGAGPLKI